MPRLQNLAHSLSDPVTKPPKWQHSLNDASPYLTIGISLAGAVLVYVGIGYLIDRWMGTSPWFLLLGGVFGIITFFIQLIRITKQLSSQDQKRKADEKANRSSAEP